MNAGAKDDVLNVLGQVGHDATPVNTYQLSRAHKPLTIGLCPPPENAPRGPVLTLFCKSAYDPERIERESIPVWKESQAKPTLRERRRTRIG
jgi:hypothetical protein